MNGKHLTGIGIARAVENAERSIPDWKAKAYRFLVSYARKHDSFMVEDVRNASVKKVPTPPSERAWGGVIRKAVKEGVVEHIGFMTVKNPKAHSTPASFWKSTIYIG